MTSSFWGKNGRSQMSCSPFPLAHGFLAFKDHGVGIADDSVAEGQPAVGQTTFRPARNVKLGTEDRGVSLVPGLHDFQ